MKLAKITTAILIITCLLAAGVQAGEQQKNIIDPGMKAFLGGDYPAAEAYYRNELNKAGTGSAAADLLRYRLGVAQFRQGKYAEALSNMEAFYINNPDNPYVAYNYGRALYGTGKLREAVPALEKAAADKELEPKVRFYLGTARLAKGQVVAGAKDLKKVADMKEKSVHAQEAEKILAAVYQKNREVSGMDKQAAVTAAPGQPTKQKPWALSFSVGMEYDSNVALIPSEQTRPSDISSDGDWRAVYSLSGVYEFVNTGKQFLGVSGNIYGTQQFKDDMFSVQNGGLSLYYKANIADMFQVRLTPFVSQTLLKASSYSLAYGITPGVTWQPAKWAWTDLNYTFSKADFTDTPQYSQENRTGKNQNVTLRQNFSFPSLLISKRNTFFAGWLSYGRADTDGSSYANHSEGFGVLGQQEFPLDFTFLTSFTYTKTKYDNGNIRSATNEKRDDSSYGVTANVFKKLDMICKNLSAYVGYRWFKNDSNIQNYYSYTSNTYTAGFIFNF